MAQEPEAAPAAVVDAESAPPKSLADEAYRRLEEMIVTLELAPGEVLSEAALAERLGIGRTPVRESLHRLAREGLVVILPRRGILVSEIDIRSQLRLLEVRREIERLMARAAARRATPAEREAFRGIAEGMLRAAEADDGRGFMRLDRRLNLAVAETARNEYAAKAMGLMHGLSRRFWFMHHGHVADLPVAAGRHAELARAIAAGEGEQAAAASDRLLDYIESITRAALDI
jgi:DNA-binding GntR family transcriptional regulator